MTDSPADLSRQLALALGYFPESVCIDTDKQGKYEPVCRVYRISYDMGPYWRWFDYRHSDIALRLLDWLMREHDGHCFPMNGRDGVFIRCICGFSVPQVRVDADTLEEAVARAVIAVGVR